MIPFGYYFCTNQRYCGTAGTAVLRVVEKFYLIPWCGIYEGCGVDLSAIWWGPEIKFHGYSLLSIMWPRGSCGEHVKIIGVYRFWAKPCASRKSDVNELGDHDLFWFVHICKPFMDMWILGQEQVQQQIKLFSVGAMKLSRDHVCGCWGLGLRQ